MIFDPELIEGQTLSNEEICEKFKCSPQGGMRRSLTTNTLVLISNYSDPTVPYHDRWIGNILHYTGMGTTGDQSLTNQNKKLAESDQTDLGIFYFEVFQPQRYIYRGRVLLAEKPYQEAQEDLKGNLRSVWIFPLKLVDKTSIIPIPEDVIDKLEKQRESFVRKLTTEELQNKALESKEMPGERIMSSRHYERNPYVTELAKRRANGYCQLCRQIAPFKTPDGYPFLETHHIIPLSKGGSDIVRNTVALCPNCHRKMHILNMKGDVTTLSELASHVS